MAYLLTWTCYGTWLHGDERGSVDRDHRRFGWPVVSPDDARREKNEARLKWPVVVLGDAARDVVQRVIMDHAHVRGWRVWAVNVRTNHVHTVISSKDATPEEMMSQLKAWATRRLCESGFAERGAKMWTEHGSTRYLWNDEAVAAAVRYVVLGQ